MFNHYLYSEMGDLNDFFAKKDKKKSKGMKFATINEIDKKLIETDKKRERLERENKDSEWKDFEEKKRDYTGLKIHNSILQNQVVEQDDEIVEDELNKHSTMCPWKLTADAVEDPTNKETEESKTEISDDPIVKKQTYIPPHLRNKNKQIVQHNNKTESSEKSGIDNKAMFPPLSTTAPPAKLLSSEERCCSVLITKKQGEKF